MTKNAKDQPEGSISSESVPEPEYKDRWHIVQPGENLTVIARVYYGPDHASHWITLYNFNRELIGENPDIVQPGMELKIPDISEFL